MEAACRTTESLQQNCSSLQQYAQAVVSCCEWRQPWEGRLCGAGAVPSPHELLPFALGTNCPQKHLSALGNLLRPVLEAVPTSQP